MPDCCASCFVKCNLRHCFQLQFNRRPMCYQFGEYDLQAALAKSCVICAYAYFCHQCDYCHYLRCHAQ